MRAIKPLFVAALFFGLANAAIAQTDPHHPPGEQAPSAVDGTPSGDSAGPAAWPPGNAMANCPDMMGMMPGAETNMPMMQMHMMAMMQMHMQQMQQMRQPMQQQMGQMQPQMRGGMAMMQPEAGNSSQTQMMEMMGSLQTMQADLMRMMQQMQQMQQDAAGRATQ